MTLSCIISTKISKSPRKSGPHFDEHRCLGQYQMNYVFILFSGHHDNSAKYALTDFVAFDEAIAEGLHFTDASETLSVVTADHSHV